MKPSFALIAFAALSAVATAQIKEDYLDVMTVKVKPEKRSDFDAAVKRVADANRRMKGDSWIAFQTEYGEGNTVTFTSTRQNFAAIETGMANFMKALNEALSPAGTQRTFQEFNNSIVSSRSEVRRRRWDLSYNVPGNEDEYAKMIAGARWLRTMLVRVRPGKMGEYVDLLKMVKASGERQGTKYPVFVSQVIAGQPGTVFYISTLRPSLATLDEGRPISEILGQDNFQKYVKGLADTTFVSETNIHRIVPELSAAPPAVLSAAPEFWQPKPSPVEGTRARKEKEKK